MGQFLDLKWPAEFNELTRLEDLLRCRICYEYMGTSVITPCSHNYCSLCIRKFLNYKTKCPICFENIFEKDLHANRILDQIMELYFSVRKKLFTCIKGGVEVKVENNEKLDSVDVEPVVPNTPTTEAIKTSRRLMRTPKKSSKDKSRQTSSSFLSQEESPSKAQTLLTPSKVIPGSSGAENAPRMLRLSSFPPKSEKKIVPDNIHQNRVPCPVCNVEISQMNINRHLDDCLKRQTMPTASFKPVNNGLEALPKYVTNLMKDSELRKVLKNYGLSTLGARKVLAKRLQKFSALYNAERDKLLPKSMAELVKLCEEEETAEANMIKKNPSDHIPNIHRETDVSVVEKFHKQYLQRHKDDFQKLVESINEREKKTAESSRSLFNIKMEDGVASTSAAAQTSNPSVSNRSFENDETVSTPSKSFYPDSDSTNMSYPLQHYSRDDATRFLTLEMSTDNQESPIKLESNYSSRLGISPESRNSTEATRSLNPSSHNSTFRSLSRQSSLNFSSPLKKDSSINLESSYASRLGTSPESRNSTEATRSLNPSSNSTFCSLSRQSSLNFSSPLKQNDINLSERSILDVTTDECSSDSDRTEFNEIKSKQFLSVKARRDLFEVTTEESSSEQGDKESAEIESKKCVTKRANVEKIGGETGDQSTDSETDLEKDLRSVGRKIKKIRKNLRTKVKTSNNDNNGENDSSNEEATRNKVDIELENSSVSDMIINKENSQTMNDGSAIGGVRRSSRKRKLVTYTPNIKGNKVLVDATENNTSGVGDSREETKTGSQKRIHPDGTGNDRSANGASKSLRKHGKR